MLRGSCAGFIVEEHVQDFPFIKTEVDVSSLKYLCYIALIFVMSLLCSCLLVHKYVVDFGCSRNLDDVVAIEVVLESSGFERIWVKNFGSEDQKRLEYQEQLISSYEKKQATLVAGAAVTLGKQDGSLVLIVAENRDGGSDGLGAQTREVLERLRPRLQALSIKEQS